jgi:photosystem II stability/assembly factor-like uncharacterized protein
MKRALRLFALLVVACVAVVSLSGDTGQPAAPAGQAGVPQSFASATYDTGFFAGLRWRNIGPNRGGRSIASVGSPSRPLEYYFGAVGGGLWKTTDAGTTWRPVTDGQIRSSSVGAVDVAESNPDIVFIGMGEACLRGNIMQGDGIYKSADAGATWRHMGLADTQIIARVRIHPRNPDVVFVAALGHPAAPNDERGVFKSTDGGKTWRKVLFRDNKTGAVDLVIDRNDPNVIYAALWEAYRTSYQMSSGGPGCGLFKSIDGGERWTELTRNPGLPKGMIGRIAVAVSGADSSRVYVLVEAEDGGVFTSSDAGATWTKVSEDRRLRQRAFYYTHIYADPKNRDTVYALNTGFYKSTDGGKTYTTIRVPHGDNHDLWIAPNDPLRMVNANDGGGNVSFNGGQTWTGQAYPTAQFYHVSTTKDFPYHVCGAQQDNSTACIPSRPARTRGGTEFYSAGGGESGYVTPHPKDPALFYAGSQGALITKYNRETGQTRDIQPYPRFFSGEPSSALKERWQWTFPIVFSPQDPNVLYISSQHVWKTTNDGQSWEKISPDLTRADPKTLGDSGGPITHDMNGPEVFATVFTIAPSKFDANTIWTGSDDGVISITRDGGRNWENITPKDLPEISRVSIIDASPSRPGAAFAAVKRYLQDDRTPYIYRTTDYGRSWTKIITGIRGDDYVHVVREDPKRPGLLYAGTEHGVYVSFDDGANWQSLSLNLPDTQVPDLVVEANDLVIATHGRSFYVLDDIGPLRQLTPTVAKAAVHLYTPVDAIRRVTPATIDYYLKAQADKVTIEILDGQGKVIRMFVGSAADDRKPAGAVPAAGPPAAGTAPRGAGMNRFTWDLHYPGATVFPGMIMWGASPERGPWAPAGAYQVRLTANGETLTTKLNVKLDPRLVGVTEADIQAQFDLAMKIRDKTSEANSAVIRIRQIKDQVRDRIDKAKNNAVTARGDALAKKLTEVEETLYQVRNRSGQDPLNFPIKINNRIASLQGNVEYGDAKPTDQSVAMFKELSDELSGILGKLDAVLKDDLAKFNSVLSGRKLDPVAAEAPKPNAGR